MQEVECVWNVHRAKRGNPPTQTPPYRHPGEDRDPLKTKPTPKTNTTAPNVVITGLDPVIQTGTNQNHHPTRLPNQPKSPTRRHPGLRRDDDYLLMSSRTDVKRSQPLGLPRCARCTFQTHSTSCIHAVVAMTDYPVEPGNDDLCLLKAGYQKVPGNKNNVTRHECNAAGCLYSQ